ncbi:MAG TPA: SsrA-binding protein [Candidatus Azoamicus sp. MARI]
MKTEIINIKKNLSFNYVLKDFFECGFVFLGWEVKSVRLNGINILNNYLIFKNHELFVCKTYISGRTFLLDDFNIERRDRKILLRKKEITSLYGMSKVKGHTLLLSRVYFKNSLIKGEICVCLGKKKYDKKLDLKLKSLSEKNFYL